MVGINLFRKRPNLLERDMANKNLNKAKEAKKDEFYTQLEDINN